MNKNLWQSVVCALILIAFNSCTKDLNNLTPTGSTTSPVTNSTTMLVNEYVASGSAQVNEFGTTSDWFEIYNPGATTMQIPDNTFYITDDSLTKDKFLLQACTIPSKGYLVIYCDGLNQTTPLQIHANFNLSSLGEFIGIYKKNADKSFTPIDARAFAAQISSQSEGRSPDGSSNWASFGIPTPGASNK
jgi:hypothetical protein